MTESQAATTRFCARVVGLLMLIIGAIVIARFSDVALLIPGLLRDGPLAFATGIFTLICGVVLFSAHHHWNSLPAIVISLLAVLTIVRGVALMFSPDFLAGLTHAVLTSAGPGVIIAGAVALLIGAWLTYVGWLSPSRP